MRRLKYFLYCNLALFISSCGVFSNLTLEKRSGDLFESKLIERLGKNHHVGFQLTEVESGKDIFSYQPDKYFIPASTTKTLTFYAGFQLLGEKAPLLHYATQGDTLFIKGAGNPTFLHPKFPTGGLGFDFIKNHVGPKVLIDTHSTLSKYGTGWAWDDYSYSFQAEKSTFPIYGNQLWVEESGITPSFFAAYIDSTEGQKNTLNRSENYNSFSLSKNETLPFTRLRIPFRTSSELTSILLQDTLSERIHRSENHNYLQWNVLYQGNNHNILEYMMLASDNFLAEQILIMIAIEKGLPVNSTSVIDYIQNNVYADVPDPIKWVDGSGLSRYNLVTPRSQVDVLRKIYQNLSWEEISRFFPIGGQTGTLKHYYSSVPPYIYAKTGTLSNNHCLTGYLISDSGKIYSFSFMNNHFTSEVEKVKSWMEDVLKHFKENY